MPKKREFPYESLGGRLKVLREKFKESLAEVSGALEIDVDSLNNIEEGIEKPSEDILLLIISHFNLKEDEAAKLWELADYSKPSDTPSDTNQKTGVLVAPTDARIIYTDQVLVTSNQYGLVINFLQESGPQNQSLIVSRVGMSRDHARSLLSILNQTLQSTTKALPAPKRDENRSSEPNKKEM